MGNMPGIKRRIASKRRSVESSPDSGSDSGICDSECFRQNKYPGNLSGYSFDPDIYNRIFSEESAGKKSHGSHFVLRRRSFSGMQRIFLPERHPHAVLQYLWNQ